MGYEKQSWRKQNFLIGLAEDLTRFEGDYYSKRNGGLSLPWWADEDMDNIWPGYVPIEAIEKLFGYQLLSDVLMYRYPCDVTDERLSGIYPEGHEREGLGYRMVESATRQVVFSDETDEEFGVFGQRTFKINQMRETLIDLPALIVDQSKGELGFASALKMRGGGVGMTCLEFPEAVVIKDIGFDYRPTLGMVDGYNGELKMGAYVLARIPRCENGAATFTRSAPKRFGLKHTGQHRERLGELRDALGIMYQSMGDYDAELHALAAWEVGDSEFRHLLEVRVPVPPAEVVDGKVTNQRTINNADTKRTKLMDLWHNDDRAATWHGTALGVFQTFNTYSQHVATFRASARGGVDGGVDETSAETDDGDRVGMGAVQVAATTGTTTDRLERTWLKVAKGDQAKEDHGVLADLADVMGVKLRDMVPA